MMKIFKSVGKNGANESDDVKVVQRCLNSHVGTHKKSLSELTVDGRCGKKTIDAIAIFQKDYVGMVNPDGRVDPNGKTFRYLTMYTAKANKSTGKTDIPKAIISQGMNDISVSYSSSIKESRRLVSDYAITLIKIALKECGMTHAVITSTLRTPGDQAEIMYGNAKLNLQKQRELYGRNGDEVLDVYEENIKKDKADVVKLMKEKIEKLLEKDKRVSNHCITIEEYKKINTLDIGLNSTKNKSKNFNKDKLTKIFIELKSQGYIKNFIDETMKSNKCWHLEISPNAKNLNTYGRSSMLLPVKYINGAYV